MRRITQIMAVFFLVLAGAPPAQAAEETRLFNPSDVILFENDAAAPAQAAPPAAEAVAQVDPCLNPNLKSVLAAIETCRTAPVPLDCVAGLPDANQKALYARFCMERPADDFTTTGKIGKIWNGGSIYGIRENEYLAKEVGGGTGGTDGMGAAQEAAKVPVAIFVPDPPLEPCACLEQLKELLKNKRTGEVPACIQSCPLPEEPPVPPPVIDPPPVEAPKAQVPFRPELGVQGNKLCGSIPVTGVGDIGWLVLLLPSLPMLIRGSRRRP